MPDQPGALLNSPLAGMQDFGLATTMDADATHVSNHSSGTRFYVAPEVTSKHKTQCQAVCTAKLDQGFIIPLCSCLIAVRAGGAGAAHIKSQ